jgi:hypothetical protein
MNTSLTASVRLFFGIESRDNPSVLEKAVRATSHPTSGATTAEKADTWAT